MTDDGGDMVVGMVVVLGCDVDGVVISAVDELVCVVLGCDGNKLDDVRAGNGVAATDGMPTDGFGTNESTTPMGPSKSTSDSGQDNSSG